MVRRKSFSNYAVSFLQEIFVILDGEGTVSGLHGDFMRGLAAETLS